MPIIKQKLNMRFIAAAAVSVILASVLGLAACDRTEKPVQTDGAAANTHETGNTSAIKLDLYTQAYYLLMNGPDGLRPSYNTFHRIRKAKTSDNIRFSSSDSLENGLALFRKGLAVQDGSMGDLDGAVRDALLTGFKLHNDELELEPYFRKHEYREDRFAKAKASWPLIQADYDAMFACMDRIETLLFKYRKIEHGKRMAVFHEKKNWLGYYTEVSLLDAQDLLALFSESDDSVKHTDLYARGNEILAKLESSLVAQRKAFEKAQANRTGHIDGYLAVNRILTSFIGSYRDLRQHKASSDLAAMYKKYNDALTAYKRTYVPENTLTNVNK